MKILSAKQMHELDRAIMEREGITSLQLMERAAEGLAARIMQRFPDASRNFKILCGCGNNGGDGLAIGRILHSHGYDVECFLLDSDRYSDDCRTNAKLVESLGILRTIGEYNKMPDFNDSDIIIDALFGSGLNREISGVAAYMACHCIFEKNFVIAIDIPSGLADNTIPDDTIEDEFGDVAEVVVRADWTLTIEAPFLSMLVPENQVFVGDFDIVPIT
ncbi:MAG: NAD(P)H-hydrate epimerase, partial [Bacteroidales bacterium]|nr:NAD(P)H-hydrate epimerase [Bacteroidales bacterium]